MNIKYSNTILKSKHYKNSLATGNTFLIFKFIVFIFFSIILSWPGWSQEPVFRFKILDIQDGLSNNKIFKIAKDNEGMVWAVTMLGINKYNGETVQVYHLPGEPVINDFAVDALGNILVATRSGLYIYNPKKEQFDLANSQNPELQSIFSQNIYDILIAKDSVWLSGANGNFSWIKFNENELPLYKSFKTKNLNPKIGSPTITSLATGNDQDLWLGDDHGQVWHFEIESEKLDSLTTLKNNLPINDMVIDTAKQLWIATNGNGLFKYHSKTNKTTHYLDNEEDNGESINNNVVLALFLGNKNRIYIGTDGGGINLYLPEKQNFTYLKQDNRKWGLSDNSILCFASGKYDIIWAGTVHGGISYFKDKIELYNISPEKLSLDQDKQGSKILEDHNGFLWLSAGRNGLRRYNPKTGETKVFIDDKTSQNGLSGNIVLSLEEDNQNRIWIGTLRGGLNIYEPKNKRIVPVVDGKEFKGIYAIEKGPDNSMWVGTQDGVMVFNSDLKLIKKIDADSKCGLGHNVVTSIYKDLKGDMWVGTEHGLNVLPNGQQQFYNYYSLQKDSTSLSSNHILSIAEGPDLSIWVGTYGFGVNRFSREDHSFKRIGNKQGSNGNIIRGILEDHHKNIWLSTDSGLTRITNGDIENFGIQKGIPAFHGGSASLSKDGRIYFGSSYGLSYFYPEDFDLRPVEPRVFFTNFKMTTAQGSTQINPKILPVDGKGESLLDLPPNNVMFTASFSNSYYYANNTTYRYKLEGLDNTWHSLEDQKSLSFSKLAPGKYTLLVRAGNNTDSISTNIAGLKLRVLPSFWQRWEVQLTTILLLIIVVYFIIWWRGLNIKKQRDKLKRVVAFQTEEVKKEKDRAYKNELELLETEKQNQELKQKHLGDELRFKTEELTNMTLRAVNKNNLLHRIKVELSEEAKKNKKQKPQLQSLIEEIKDSLAIDTEWEEFYELFHQVHPNFIKNLKEKVSSLTDRDLRLCALIKMNFPSQQIATLFSISLSSVKVARHRLRKRLNLQKGDSFQNYFSGIAIEKQ